jgi:hypothetical protein
METKPAAPTMRLMSAVLMLVAAVIFAWIGFRSLPRNNTYIILAIVFAILAASGFRRARRL